MTSQPLPNLPPGVTLHQALVALRRQDPDATPWHLLNRLAAPGLSILTTLEEVKRRLPGIDAELAGAATPPAIAD